MWFAAETYRLSTILQMSIQLLLTLSFVNSAGLDISVSRVVEFPGAGLSRPKTINSEPNGATQTSEAATEAGRASANFTT